jgi:hypothetical protein
MKNNYGLPNNELIKIFKRDKLCVYCRKKMTAHIASKKRGDWWSIEHLNYLPPWNDPLTVVICCWSCNSSRGNKKISDWFKSEYCLKRGIDIKTVPSHVKKYINDKE